MNREGREARRFRRALATLPPVTREVFRLHRVEGLAYAEIAARLGITSEAVERHVAHALYELARRVDRPWWKFWWGSGKFRLAGARPARLGLCSYRG